MAEIKGENKEQNMKRKYGISDKLRVTLPPCSGVAFAKSHGNMALEFEAGLTKIEPKYATRSPLWQPRPPPASLTTIRRSTPLPSSRASQRLSPNLKITNIAPHLPPPPIMSTFATRFTDRVFADASRVEHIRYDDTHQVHALRALEPLDNINRFTGVLSPAQIPLAQQWLDVLNDAAGFLPTLKKPPGRLSAPLMCAGIAITEALDLTPITGDFKSHLHIATVWALQLELVIKFPKATHLLINANPKVAQLADLGRKQELFYQSQVASLHKLIPAAPPLKADASVSLPPISVLKPVHWSSPPPAAPATCREAKAQGSSPPPEATVPHPKSRPPVAPPPSTSSHKAEKPTPPPTNATARHLEKIRDSFGKHHLARCRAPKAPTLLPPAVIPKSTATSTSIIDDAASAVSSSAITPSASASNADPPPQEASTSTAISIKAPQKASSVPPGPSGQPRRLSHVSDAALDRTLRSLKAEIFKARKGPKKPSTPSLPAPPLSPPAPQKASLPLGASSSHSGSPQIFPPGYVPVLIPLHLLGAFLSSLPPSS
ncbi:hypothetical protein BOTBODRAFT_168795 [Botryobasidium botryosum FD-172 SS1]|uniref:Uncharacterized protein n=1 Tax=Botryobasidium botryosum (strain FD-172 SS1) TaxID=930990 RepID=A0A067N3J0_BOTB1|nr:hypothetical protein BOTBODRAFT_168795 [Botryobasidium botryosum FD-172 SS1]